MAYAVQNREFGNLWRLRVMAPARSRLLAVLTGAIGRGELPGDLNLDLAIAQLIGPMLYGDIFAALNTGLPKTASNSHSDYFVKRLVAILADLREALAIYRPGAFGQVTGLD
jgi:hypothetical protein